MRQLLHTAAAVAAILLIGGYLATAAGRHDTATTTGKLIFGGALVTLIVFGAVSLAKLFRPRRPAPERTVPYAFRAPVRNRAERTRP